jgi:hypothetical protein
MMNYKLFFVVTFSLILLVNCESSTKKVAVITVETVKKPNFELAKTVQISENVQLAFAKRDTIFDLYYEPFFIINNKNYPLADFDNMNRSSGDILGISPSGNYFVMDYLTIGYVDKNGENILHENYFCVVIDIQSKRILEQMQSDCDGEWNKQNQWVSGGKAVIRFD